MLYTRLFFGLLIFVFCFTSSASTGKLNKDFFKPITETENPLAKFSKEWANPKYLACNTAKNSPYLSKSEKEVIYILNMARMNPSLFLQTVAKRYPKISNEPDLLNSSYYQSFLLFLKDRKPLMLLFPEKKLVQSAFCHAVSSGKLGYEGHDRQTENCKTLENFNGECCHYGSSDPLEVVLDLMIDEDVPSLGHRKLLFENFSKIGVSIQPHSKYRWNTVLDFAL